MVTTETHASLARVDALAGHFEALLRRHVDSVSAEPVANLNDAMAYALGTDVADPLQRGKRIRPVLCLLSAEALGAPLARAEPFALAIELMHNFCLVHDDIEDGDTMRRGREAVWVKYGLAHGINVGDYLLVHAMKVLAESNPPGLGDAARVRLMQLLAHTLDRTHVGQALDIGARADRELTVERYLEIVREKTGFYLAAPIQGGAIAAGAGEEVVAAVGEMAALLGPLFQIADDIIDLTHGKGREAVGSDIREGKRSFLVAHAAASCGQEDRERLFDILDRPRAETASTDVDWVAELFERHGAVEAGREHCRRLYTESRTRLAQLPAPLARTLGPVFESLTERIR
jgi:geranylgeranyl pyrophosphate synthase